jgi:hypothetical protein
MDPYLTPFLPYTFIPFQSYDIGLCSDRDISQVMAEIASDQDEGISYTFPKIDTTIYITFLCILLNMHIKK